ncbi:MAG: hypothetical protein ABI114_00820 [Rhodanobacter sp.]
MYKYSLLAATLASTMMFAQSASAQDATPMTAPQSAAMAASALRDPALKPVFDQFGGKAGLVTLMNDFMDNLMADSRTKPYFAPTDREHIK